MSQTSIKEKLQSNEGSNFPSSGFCGVCHEYRSDIEENTYQGVPVTSCRECYPDGVAEILDNLIFERHAL